jgi:SOS-response transcriptional repressor LexA
MSGFSELLDKKMKQMGMNYNKLAVEVGVSAVYISQILRGRRIPKDSILVKLSEVLRLDPRQVLSLAHYEKAPASARPYLGTGQGGSATPEKFENVGPYPLGRGQRIPVLGWVQAGQFSPSESADLTPQSPDDYVYSDILGRNLFALRVENDSMEPVFHEGDIIIVNPNIKPESGDYVIARLKDKGEVTFKKLVVKEQRVILRPLNTKYDDIMLPEDEEFEIIGKVVERKTIF